VTGRDSYNISTWGEMKGRRSNGRRRRKARGRRDMVRREGRKKMRGEKRIWKLKSEYQGTRLID